tara:strand:- start:85 stop:414 length:330 start_codon:yes stop_codon:yes gene_type:complete
MISEKKVTHLYLRPNNSLEDVFNPELLSSNFTSDLILDLLSFETIDENIVISLNQILQKTTSNGFCMVVVLKEIPTIANIGLLNIVPTLIEAEDYIKMEKIQRDLGLSQ